MKINSLAKYWLVFSLLFSSKVFANEAADASRVAELSVDPVWLSLLHYEKSSDSNHPLLSAIHSQEFFLSEQGRYNPVSELKSTIAAMLETTDTKIDESAFCRFPARLIWLRKKLGKNFAPHAELSTCTEYNQWNYHGSVESLSIVFATGYLGNPASFYGHTLLKFNSSKKLKRNSLQDSSLNYGAIDTEHDNPVTYIANGLFGGYDAGFSHIQYYFHNHNYGENELRDMWEYELALNSEEVEFLVAHSWEVLGKKYTYYFLKENCAYRMAELFNIIEGLNILPDNRPWTYPQAILQKIATVEFKGKPLIRAIKKHPSRQSRLYLKFAQLNAIEKKTLNAIVEDISLVQSEQFRTLESTQQYRILDTLLDYYQLIRDKSKLEKDVANRSYQKILNARFTLPGGESNFNPITIQQPPHEGRDPSLIAISRVNQESIGDYWSLRVRPAYYDSLDASSGHIAFSNMSMGELGISVNKSDFAVDYLDVFHVQSINSNATGLPGDSGHAWNLRFGMERLNPVCFDCSLLRFQGDIGYSKAINSQLVVAAYLGGALQENRSKMSNYFARGKLMAQMNFSDQLRMRFDYEYRSNFKSPDQDLEITEATLRYQFNKNWESRLFYRSEQTTEAGISIGYFW